MLGQVRFKRPMTSSWHSIFAFAFFDFVSAGPSGCAVISGSSASYGEPFNAAGGGAFAMLWDDEGLHFCK
jgi:hypothetical protein